MRIYLLLIAIGLTSCGDKKTQPTVTERTPNIILIFTDDQGYQDVGVFGSPDIKTPNLDQMAADGLQLTHYYAAQAVCSASRAGILTGCYPNRIGIHNALGPDNTHGINASETTIAEMLKKKGMPLPFTANGIWGTIKSFYPPDTVSTNGLGFHTRMICGLTTPNREPFSIFQIYRSMKMKR